MIREVVTARFGMEHFRAPHTIANQGEIFWTLLEQYKLRHKVAYFTTDNATNNDTVTYDHAKVFTIITLAFHPVSARMRCFGHVINLVVNAFLWRQNADAIVQDLRALDGDADTMLNVQLWWKQGPIERLHNICTWILHCPQRCDHFTEMATQIIPNATAYILLIGSIIRWHGNMDAVEHDFILRAALD